MSEDLFPHNDRDCHGTLCAACGCCQHSTDCIADPFRCPNRDCGCYE